MTREGLYEEDSCLSASECVPFIKAGGDLRMFAGHLPKEFDPERLGCDGWLFRITAASRNIFRNQFEYVTHFYLGCGGPYVQDRICGCSYSTQLDGVTYYFIDNQEYFNSGFAPYAGCTLRYSRSEVLHFLIRRFLSMLPAHRLYASTAFTCHDWQAGLDLPVCLFEERIRRLIHSSGGIKSIYDDP